MSFFYFIYYEPTILLSVRVLSHPGHLGDKVKAKPSEKPTPDAFALTFSSIILLVFSGY